jgi:hypothetical protein
MEQILVIRPNGEEYLLEDRAAFRIINSISQKTELRSNDTIDIDITSRNFHDFKIGDTFYYLGRKYTLNQIPRYQKNSRNEYQYSATFEGVMYDLRRASYDVNIDTTGSAIYGETLTADLELFARVLIENANRVFTYKWGLGEIPEGTETKTITFSEEDNCLGVLQKLCDEYDTDFIISTDENDINRINFLQVGEEIPLEFKVGFNQGLYNLIREKVDSSDIITRLKVYGSDQNLGSSYRSNKLVLPGKNKPNSYIESTDAIQRFGIYESVKLFDDIYPKRIGIVSSINSDSPYKFSDSSMDFDLNEKDENGTKYLIVGSAAKIHFNTGALAGYEFDVHAYNHSNKEFHIIKFADENGYEFPSKDNDAFRITPGDEYVILNIQMPQAYVDNAENELLQKANEYLSDKLEPNVLYSMDIDTLYLQRQLNETVIEFFKVGDFIKVIDVDFGINRFIRIKSIEKDLRNPFDYKLVLSDSKVSNLVSGTIAGEIKNINNIIKLNNLNNPAKARRNWKDAQEVLNMVFDIEGDYYTEKIKPNSIETTHLQVGAKSMQFNLIDSFFEPNVNGNPNIIRWSSCNLVHFTIEENIKDWQIGASTKTLEANKPYYIYARCNKDNSIGIIDITEFQYTVDQGNYYYFLIGIVNSYDNEIKAREVSLMYGFSTFSGRFIKTGRIESSGGGNTYFDLDTGEISGKITFTNDSPAFNQVRDSIEIGGRNLIENSSFENEYNFIDLHNVNLERTSNYGGILPKYGSKFLVAFNNAQTYFFYFGLQKIEIEKSSEYILSFNYILPFSSDHLQISFIYDNGYETIPITETTQLSYDWGTKRTFVKFTTPSNAKTLYVRFDAYTMNWLCLDGIKLEKGNKATDWSPAPEDVQKQITELDNTMKRIDGVTSFLDTTIDQNVIATGVLMVGSEFQSNAGLSGLNESGSKSVRLWAGGTAQNRNKAAWNTLDDGTMNFYHPNGQLAFKFGLENGAFAMNGYHKDGYLMFKLDPNRGLVNVAYSQESWSERKFFQVPVTNLNATDDQIRVYLTPLITQSNGIYTIEQSKLNYQCWEYFNGTIPSNADWQQYNGYKSNNTSRTLNIPNGWYLQNYGPLEQDSSSLKPAVSIVYIENGVERQNRIIVMTNL